MSAETAKNSVIVHRAGSDAAFLIICDHAGREIPTDLGDLGLPAAAFERHIAWDIGASALSLALSERLQACAILQRWSRLVIDCNRKPGAPDSIPQTSDGQPIAGNASLTDGARQARVTQVFEPYHAAIAAELDARTARRLSTRLVFVHSFTPRLATAGAQRPWHFGVLHEGSSALSRAMLQALRDEPDFVTGDNQPYAMDGTDYSAPRHALARGLDYLELEVRQDLIADAAGVERIADVIERALRRCAPSTLFEGPPPPFHGGGSKSA